MYVNLFFLFFGLILFIGIWQLVICECVLLISFFFSSFICNLCWGFFFFGARATEVYNILAKKRIETELKSIKETKPKRSIWVFDIYLDRIYTKIRRKRKKTRWFQVLICGFFFVRFFLFIWLANLCDKFQNSFKIKNLFIGLNFWREIKEKKTSGKERNILNEMKMSSAYE